MATKLLIVLLLISNLIALGISCFTLMHDQGKGVSRTAHWLMIRVSLAGLLLATIVYGVWSGDLAISAPWHYPQQNGS